MRIAITGTLGAGKSSVSAILRKYGYTVVDADKLAKSYYEPTSEIYSSLVKLLKPYDVYDKYGYLDKPRYSALFFTHPQLMQKVTDVLYHQMRDDFTKLSKQYDPFIAEVPLLFEAHMEDLFDHILVVTTNEDMVLQRLKQSRGMDHAAYRQRMVHQYDDDYKKKHGDTIIENDSTMDELERKVMAWIKALTDPD